MITGSLVALVTPMHSDGSVHWEHLDKLVDFHLDNGTHGIVAVGTTGESATLDPEEHMRVVGHIIKRVNGRIPVIAGTGGNSTREAIELADIPNIIGIKDATGNIPRGAELVEAVRGRLVVYSGDDATAAGLMLAGAKGNVSVTANVAPKGMAALCEAAIAGNEEETERLNELLMPLNRKLFLEANPIPVKWALYHMGMIGEGIRLPLTPLSDRFHGEVEDALKASGVL